MVHPLLKDTHTPRGGLTVYGSDGRDLFVIRKEIEGAAQIADQLGHFSTLVGRVRAYLDAEKSGNLAEQDTTMNHLAKLMVVLGEPPNGD
jgi:hypothetical protein